MRTKSSLTTTQLQRQFYAQHPWDMCTAILWGLKSILRLIFIDLTRGIDFTRTFIFKTVGVKLKVLCCGRKKSSRLHLSVVIFFWSFGRDHYHGVSRGWRFSAGLASLHSMLQLFYFFLGKMSTNITPFVYVITLPADCWVLNFFGLGDPGPTQWRLLALFSGS